MIPAIRQRNYLQSALYFAIVGILATILVNRLLVVAEIAEKATMEASVSSLQSALYARLAFYVLRGDAAAIASLESTSPFVTAEATAGASYAGEFPGIAPASVSDGTWYFDSLRHELVYRVRHAGHLRMEAETGRQNEIRYRTRIVRAGNGAYRGVEFRPVAPFRWEPVP
ncbi:MAG: hypothetical protein ACREVQ_00180 [Burkholderiales bacterium]